VRGFAVRPSSLTGQGPPAAHLAADCAARPCSGDLGLSKQKMNTFVSGSKRGIIPWMSPELFFTHQGSATQLGKVTEKVQLAG
jgi:hypothetical protein